jgi:hypothetical protein
MNRLIILLALITAATTAEAQWDDCPFGIINDTYPGECGRYVDTDDDGICDRSQPAPEDRVAPEEAAEQSESTRAKEPVVVKRRGYNLIPVTLLLTALYLVSLRMAQNKIISLVTQRRVWNILLLITFLVSGGLGVILVAQINYGTAVHLPFNILYWHVEAGIAMAAISVFHILWHMPYFKAILRRG